MHLLSASSCGDLKFTKFSIVPVLSLIDVKSLYTYSFDTINIFN